MEILMSLFALFGPLYAYNTISPLNEFKGAGIVLSDFTTLYAKTDTSTNYLTTGKSGLYYNYDKNVSFAAEIEGRFYYIQADTTFSRFYLNTLQTGAKFGFPLTRNSDMGIGMFIGIPVASLSHTDSIDIENSLLTSEIHPALAIYHLWRQKKLGIASSFEYKGAAYGEQTFSLSFGSTFFYELNGARFFASSKGIVYPGIIDSKRPKELLIGGGVSFVSPFNAAFTINFIARPLVYRDIQSKIFIPKNTFKYGLGITIESWFPSEKYRRKYTPKEEKAPRFVLIRRFRKLSITTKDSATGKELENVNLKIYRNEKLLKEISINKTVLLDSLKPGKYSLTFEKNRYLSKTISFNLRKDTTIIVILSKRQLKDTGMLVLQIKNRENHPIKNAKITVVDINFTRSTDTTGTVSLKLKSGKYLIRVSKKGYRTISRYFVIGKEETRKESLILRKR